MAAALRYRDFSLSLAYTRAIFALSALQTFQAYRPKVGLGPDASESCERSGR
jgi:hypothetical protein